MTQIALSGALLLLAMAQASAADSFKFTDVRGVHGQARSMAVKTADALKCGWTKDGRILLSVPAMQQCMLSRGWQMIQYTPDPSGRQGNSVQFTDLSRSGKRGEAALHVDTAKCEARGYEDATSPGYKSCMLRLGWRYYAYSPPSVQSPTSDDDDSADQAAAAEERFDDDRRRDDEQRRNDQQTQDMINTQNMINAQQDATNAQNAANAANAQ